MSSCSAAPCWICFLVCQLPDCWTPTLINLSSNPLSLLTLLLAESTQIAVPPQFYPTVTVAGWNDWTVTASGLDQLSLINDNAVNEKCVCSLDDVLSQLVSVLWEDTSVCWCKAVNALCVSRWDCNLSSSDQTKQFWIKTVSIWTKQLVRYSVAANVIKCVGYIYLTFQVIQILCWKVIQKEFKNLSKSEDFILCVCWKKSIFLFLPTDIVWVVAKSTFSYCELLW